MRVLARYISGMFLKNFLMATFGLTVLFVFQASFEMVKQEGFAFGNVLLYNLYGTPEVFVRMVPPSVLISTVLTLSGLNRANELTACFSIGIGLVRIMTVILSLIFVISCSILVLQDRILPAFFRKQTNYYWHVLKNRPDFYLDFRQSKIWYKSGQMIYNLHSFDPRTQKVQWLTVYSFTPDFELVEVVNAQEAEYNEKNWKLNDGTVTVFVGADKFPVSKKFKTKELVIDESPRDFMDLEREVDGLRLKELFAYIQKVKKTGADARGYEVKFHYRVSVSFLPIVMGLLALPFSVSGRREGGLARDLGICLGLTFVYWLFYNLSLTMGKSGSITPWIAAWLPTVLFLGLAVGLIARKKA